MYSRFTLVMISINLNSSQLNMFREIILPIFRSTRLCATACGVMHTPRCCRPTAGNIVGLTESSSGGTSQGQEERPKTQFPNFTLFNCTLQEGNEL